MTETVIDAPGASSLHFHNSYGRDNGRRSHPASVGRSAGVVVRAAVRARSSSDQQRNRAD